MVVHCGMNWHVLMMCGCIIKFMNSFVVPIFGVVLCLGCYLAAVWKHMMIVYDVIVELVLLYCIDNVVFHICDDFMMIIFCEIACYDETCIMVYRLQSSFCVL